MRPLWVAQEVWAEWAEWTTERRLKTIVRTTEGQRRGDMRADISAIIGSLDIVFGEIDR